MSQTYLLEEVRKAANKLNVYRHMPECWGQLVEPQKFQDEMCPNELCPTCWSWFHFEAAMIPVLAGVFLLGGTCDLSLSDCVNIAEDMVDANWSARFGPVA